MTTTAPALRPEDPLARPPATAEDVLQKIANIKAVLTDLEWTMATDAAGAVDPTKEGKAYSSINLALDAVAKLTQPVREVFHPTFDREATLLAAVDRLSPSTRYGYVRYPDLCNASGDVRYDTHFRAPNENGDLRWYYPLVDVLHDLVARGVLERSGTGDYRRPGQKGRGERVAQPRLRTSRSR